MSTRKRIQRTASAASALLALSCAPITSPPFSDDRGAGGALHVATDPPASLDAVPPVTWLRIRASRDRPLDPERVFLIEGEVRAGHLSQIAGDDISGALSERLIPALRWAVAADEVIVAPSAALSLGGGYAIASGSPAAAVPLSVVESDPLPSLPLLWPPDGAAVDRPVGVWCQQEALPLVAQHVELPDASATAVLANGISNGAGGVGCVHLATSAHGPWPAEMSVAPPPLLVAPDGSPVARLAPTPLTLDGELTTASPTSCAPDEIRLGTACGRVADDRIYLATDDIPLLWAFSDAFAPELFDQVIASKGGDELLIHALQPAAKVHLQISTLDVAGRVETTEVVVSTLPPMAHVVLNEVLANPVGPEPEQEWIELYNDGLAAADLEGYVIEDIGGDTPLPPATLAPGRFALVVNAGFDSASDYDPPTEPGTLILRVDKLGKGGLKNDGEPLKLVDSAGEVVSRFPALPKPKSGRSVMRIHPKAPDGNEESFALSTDDATPGLPNS